MTRIRLGAVGYLNARPLVFGLGGSTFDVGRVVPGLAEGAKRFDLRFDVPSKCAQLLHERSIDVGMIPSIEYLRNPPASGPHGDHAAGSEYRIVPDLAIASRGPVASVALYTKRPMQDVRSIAMDTSSRTSVALVRVLCARHFGIAPAIEPRGPNLASMLSDCDAALIIGDNALFQSPVGSRQSPVGSRQSPVGSRQSAVGSRQSPVGSRQSPVGSRRSPVASRQSPVGSRQSPVASRQSPVANLQSAVENLQSVIKGGQAIEKIDLGEVWTEMTGLPFVWAFWAGRPAALSKGDISVLRLARDAGVRESELIAQEYLVGSPDKEERQRVGARYLRDNIKYDLGPDERAGLELFYQYSAELGIVDAVAPLRFFGEL